MTSQAAQVSDQGGEDIPLAAQLASQRLNATHGFTDQGLQRCTSIYIDRLDWTPGELLIGAAVLGNEVRFLLLSATWCGVSETTALWNDERAHRALMLAKEAAHYVRLAGRG